MEIVNKYRQEKLNSQTPRFITIPRDENEELGFSLKPGNSQTPYATIEYVKNDSVFDQSGLKNGMILSRLNGKSTFEMSENELKELLEEIKLEKKLEFVLVGRDRNSNEAEISLDTSSIKSTPSGNDHQENSVSLKDSSKSDSKLSYLQSNLESEISSRTLSSQDEDSLNLYKLISEVVESLVTFVDSRQELTSLKYLSNLLLNPRFKKILRYYEVLWSFHCKNMKFLEIPLPQSASIISDSKQINDLKIKINVACEKMKNRKLDDGQNIENSVSKTIDAIMDTYEKSLETCKNVDGNSNRSQRSFSKIKSSRNSIRSVQSMCQSTASRNNFDNLHNSLKLQYNDKVQLVRLELGDQPIGITMVNKENCVIVSRVIKQSVADMSGLIKKGDEILEINDTPVKGMDVEMIANIVRDIRSQTITFLIIPCDCEDYLSSNMNSLSCSDAGTLDQSIIWNAPYPSPYDWEYNEIHTSRALSIRQYHFLRARFNYNPLEDTYSPCPFLGLKFRIGDILEIIDREDHNYWQARKIKKNKFFYSFEAENRVGLIPSKIFYHQCEAINHALIANKNHENASQRCLNCLNCMSAESDAAYESKSVYSQSYQEMKLVPSDPFNRRPLVILTRKVEPIKSIFSRMEVERGASCYHLKLQNDRVNLENPIPHEILNQISDISRCGKVCMMIFDDKHAEILSKCSVRPYIVLMMEPQIRISTRFKWENWPSSQFQNAQPKDLLHALPFIDATLTWKNFDSLLVEFNEILTGLLALPQWIPIV